MHLTSTLRRAFQPLVSFLIGFSVAFTLYNRFANTYFWNRSLQVQILLLFSLSILMAALIYFLWHHLLPASWFRPITWRFVGVVFTACWVWMMLPWVNGVNEGIVRTPAPFGSLEHLWTLFLRLLEVIPVVALFRFKVNRIGYFIFLSLYSIYLLIMLVRAPVQLHGDGFEYLYMTQAFQNHLSPNLTDADIDSLQPALIKNNVPTTINPFNGFFPTKSGLKFSYHFWLYSLVVAPAKISLEGLGLNGLLAFQITNTILFLAALWSVLLLSALEENRKVMLTAFLCVNPAVWYLTWWHSEVFTYSLAILSLVFFTRRQYKTAALFSAIASTQNPPLIFLAGYLAILDVAQYWPKITIVRLIKTALPLAPAFMPSIFYTIFYGTPNIIYNQSAGLSDITTQKFIDFFLDLNMGILPYMPVLLAFFLIVFFKNIWEQSYLGMGWGLIIMIIVLSATQTRNWNSDCAGLMRYAVWVTPVIAFFVVDRLKMASVWKDLWMGGIAYQLALVVYFGGVTAMISPVEMSPFARIVLDRFPQFYSPEKETFIERTNHNEGQSVFSLYASHDDEVKKILTNYENFVQFRSLEKNGIAVQDMDAVEKAGLYLKDREGMHYLNFPNHEIKISNYAELRKVFSHLP